MTREHRCYEEEKRSQAEREAQFEQMAHEAGLPYIGWRPVKQVGDWVQMRSGAGERSWHHVHRGEEDDYGGNPGDRDGAGGAIKCRTCGQVKT